MEPDLGSTLCAGGGDLWSGTPLGICSFVPLCG